MNKSCIVSGSIGAIASLIIIQSATWCINKRDEYRKEYHTNFAIACMQQNKGFFNTELIELSSEDRDIIKTNCKEHSK